MQCYLHGDFVTHTEQRLADSLSSTLRAAQSVSQPAYCTPTVDQLFASSLNTFQRTRTVFSSVRTRLYKTRLRTFRGFNLWLVLYLDPRPLNADGEQWANYNLAPTTPSLLFNIYRNLYFGILGWIYINKFYIYPSPPLNKTNLFN
jgi:hypothetical protein